MVLTTDRLVLREFVEEDWPAVLAYQNDPRYLHYYRWTERTAEEVRAFVDRMVAQQGETPRLRYQFAIVLATGGPLIGNVGIRLKGVDSHAADIGYELNPRCWGFGYATEAARAVAALGFGQFGLHRISAHCVADNGASARVLEKLGMQLEGRRRDGERFKGRYWDTLHYAMLEQAWREIR